MMNETLRKALAAIHSYELADAMALVRQFLSDNPYLRHDDSLNEIGEDYSRMLEYMRMGYPDEQREVIYKKLLGRLARFVCNLNVSHKRQANTFYIEASKRALTGVFSHEQVKKSLESFVSDVALLSLENEDVRAKRSETLFSQHLKYRDSLFCYLSTSLQWTHDDAAFYEQLLLSPTIDTVDAQLMLSAIMLSCINDFDFLKLSVLLHVYQQATEERLKQRALVGWLFALGRDIPFPDEQEKIIREACQDEQTVTDIIDTQKQVLFCMNADRDNDRIKQDIIPTLMKNSNFNITRQGIITEKEDDPMEDILNPGDADRRMEEMEASIQQMINMQKSGADIYFGGFSQMKRFSFFYMLSNWFTPFFLEHPGLTSVTSKLGNRKFLMNVLQYGPFCDSDKYSFALAIHTIIDRLPQNMLSMLDNAEALGPVVAPEEMQKPAYIRRMYLQDLFRFFRLYHDLKGIESPFSPSRFVFTSLPDFGTTAVSKHYADLCMFFRKQKNSEAFRQLIVRYNDDGEINSLLLRGMYYLENGQAEHARSTLSRLVDMAPDHERGLFLLARASFAMGLYEDAEKCYSRLSQLNPKNKGYVLNLCLTFCKNEKFEDASGLLYKLDYENPDQPDIQRVLAWALMGLHRLEQAERIYLKLMDAKKPLASDFLNAGYCYWFMGSIQKAIECFKKYMSSGDMSLKDEFQNDEDMLRRYSVSVVDKVLMLDMVKN